MDLLWCTVLCSIFCLCRGASITRSKNDGQFEIENGSHLASRHQKPSPIDIEIDDIEEENFPPLNNPFENPEFDKEPVACTNDGKTVSCSIDKSSAILYGGPLKDDYIFATMHFHWGKSDLYGSEHMLGGRRFASEIHVIFRNGKYPDFKTATEMDDGLGILAWFGMISEEDSHAMKELFTMAEKLVEFNTTMNGMAGSVIGFLRELARPLDENSADWLTYDGAITMDPYTDCAKWIIYCNPYAISHRQLEILRHLKREDGTPNLEHTKNVFPSNNRPVYMPTDGQFYTDESDLTQYILS